MEKRGEIILYQPDSEVKLEVRLNCSNPARPISVSISKTYTSKENWMKVQLFGISEQFGKRDEDM